MKPEQYLEAYPDLYKEFIKITEQMIKWGYKHGSAEAVFNVIRWERRGELKEDGFKLNNNFKAYFARKYMKDCPQHKGFFRTRRSKYDYQEITGIEP